MTASETVDDGIVSDDDATRRPILNWIWLALFCLAFAPTAAWLWERWTISIWYSGHGIFMPFILVYLLWERLRDDRGPASSSPWGFLFLVPGLAMLVLDTAIDTRLLAAVGLIVCLPGLCLLVLGAERTRGLSFALVIAVFMLPIPAGFVSAIHLVLRDITTYGTHWVVQLIGIPVWRQGFVLSLPNNAIEVADACSGFSTLYAAVTTALILGHLSGSRTRGLALVGASVVLALICNVIRVTALVLMVHYYSADLLRTSLHEGSGIASFALVIVLLFVLAGRRTFRDAPA